MPARTSSAAGACFTTALGRRRSVARAVPRPGGVSRAPTLAVASRDGDNDDGGDGEEKRTGLAADDRYAYYSPTRAPVFVHAKPNAHDIATGRDPQRVRVFDTTLRDGEQSPGASLSVEEKLSIARQLAKLGVDVIEAGFPASSEGDFEAVSRIAAAVGNRADPPIVCGLARATAADVQRCWDAIREARFPRIHTFVATSDVHMEYKLRKTREQVLDIITKQVRFARSLCQDVEFSAEDATRSDPQFLYEAFSRAIEAGATTINVADTCGYVNPVDIYNLLRGIRDNVRGVNEVVVSIHGHDDLGMAAANFLAAAEGGARQIEVTVNGIGERAGNASLEEVVMALYVRQRYYAAAFGLPDDRPLTNINYQEIYKSSRMVSSLTGMSVQPNKAIVGANAFRHASGIHQDGVLKNERTYSIMDAKLVGVSQNALVLGKLSGRNAFRSRLNEMGYELSEDDVNRAFVRFKELADKKRDITDADLESLVSDEMKGQAGSELFKLKHVQVQCGSASVPTATVTLLVLASGEEVTTAKTGTGPVDAAYRAINALVSTNGVDVTLLEYHVSSVTSGIDSLGEVQVRLRDEAKARVYSGFSANTDVVEASVQAYLNAVNRCSRQSGTPSPIHPQYHNI